MSIKAQNKNKISYPLIFMHLGCLGVFFVPFSATMLIIFLAVYCLHVFTLTAGYHRYFSHKSFKTSRLFQFILAFLGTMAAQKDPYGGPAITDFTMNMPTAKMTPTRPVTRILVGTHWMDHATKVR